MSDYSYLFREQYGTSLLADAAFRAGIEVGLPSSGLRPLDVHGRLAGPAITVEANNDLVSILEAVHRAAPNDVVVIANHTADVALIGDLIGTEAVRKGLAGFVVDGLVRDIVELVDLRISVHCRGCYPVGPLKVPAAMKGIGIVGGLVSIGGATVTPGMWVFGDADGLVILEGDDLEAVFDHAAVALRQEEALAREIASGTALGDAFELDSFLSKRRKDPQADFNAHLAEIDRAI
ncbi:putative regulator of ribonuclease activity [bacterium BMS3Abin02]|nr:putative regulator of ribonuclease activity [bacterium BMS3Abin02]GBE23234.1 putative regulator of ribonuclease activity [bacterium BMS3Bbin01]HDH26626.1 RraA family protein [Actinomycetota bacterium]